MLVDVYYFDRTKPVAHDWPEEFCAALAASAAKWRVSIKVVPVKGESEECDRSSLGNEGRLP